LSELSTVELIRLLKERGYKIIPPKKEIVKVRRIRKIRIPRRTLRKYIREKLTIKEIGAKFGVSKRTISRRIKEYGFKGLLPKGKRPKPIPIEWIMIEEYYKKLHEEYTIKGISAETSAKYVHEKELVFNYEPEFPKEKYNACMFYYLANYDGLYVLMNRIVRYGKKNVGFKEIHEWAKRSGMYHLQKMFYKASFWVSEIVGYQYLSKDESKDFLFKRGKEFQRKSKKR